MMGSGQPARPGLQGRGAEDGLLSPASQDHIFDKRNVLSSLSQTWATTSLEKFIFDNKVLKFSNNLLKYFIFT